MTEPPIIIKERSYDNFYNTNNLYNIKHNRVFMAFQILIAINVVMVMMWFIAIFFQEVDREINTVSKKKKNKILNNMDK